MEGKIYTKFLHITVADVDIEIQKNDVNTVAIEMQLLHACLARYLNQ